MPGYFTPERFDGYIYINHPINDVLNTGSDELPHTLAIVAGLSLPTYVYMNECVHVGRLVGMFGMHVLKGDALLLNCPAVR